jgi:methylated-DNA-protein-cysteine methyltransferase-like protein
VAGENGVAVDPTGAESALASRIALLSTGKVAGAGGVIGLTEQAASASAAQIIRLRFKSTRELYRISQAYPCYTRRVQFSSPPDPRAYNARVYALVQTIPAGRVASYGQLARLIVPVAGVDPDTYFRMSPRWVGGAMAQAPDGVPWQRVINSQGKVSERPGFGVLVQRKLLEEEGVVFDDRDRVDLKRFGWTPDPDWLRENGYAAPETPAGSPEQPRLL